MKKIFVTGANGLVGSRFTELYSAKFEINAPNYPEFDLTDSVKVKEAIDQFNPDVVIHLAAYTNVGEAENQKGNKSGDCWKINVEGTRNLISAIDPKKTQLIHISTDYVFSGLGEVRGPFPENTPPESDSSKLTWYGVTKAEAERLITSLSDDNKSILRIICPVRAKYHQKLDFLRKPLSLFDQGKLYPLFNDQYLTISFIDEVALTLETIIEKKALGFFHASTPDTSTPYELVSYLVEKARGVKGAVKATSLDEFIRSSGSSPVRYPKYGGLKVVETEKALGIKFSPWKAVIDTIISQGIEF